MLPTAPEHVPTKENRKHRRNKQRAYGCGRVTCGAASESAVPTGRLYHGSASPANGCFFRHLHFPAFDAGSWGGGDVPRYVIFHEASGRCATGTRSAAMFSRRRFPCSWGNRHCRGRSPPKETSAAMFTPQGRLWIFCAGIVSTEATCPATLFFTRPRADVPREPGAQRCLAAGGSRAHGGTGIAGGAALQRRRAQRCLPRRGDFGFFVRG